MFEAAGWQTITVKYGRRLRQLFARHLHPGEEQLHRVIGQRVGGNDVAEQTAPRIAARHLIDGHRKPVAENGAVQKHDRQSGQRRDRSFDAQMHHDAGMASYRPPQCGQVT